MNNENQKLIGKRVRAAREEAGLSQEQLGTKVGYSAMGISHLENGNRKVKIEDLQRIAKTLGVEITYFLEPIAPTYPATFFRRGDEDITEDQKRAEQKAMKQLDELVKNMGN